MATLTIELDRHTENSLRQMSQKEGGDMSEIAARLLARAIRAARPRPVFDTEAIRKANAAFVEEDRLLAESGSTERADLLAQEDRL